MLFASAPADPRTDADPYPSAAPPRTPGESPSRQQRSRRTTWSTRTA